MRRRLDLRSQAGSRRLAAAVILAVVATAAPATEPVVLPPALEPAGTGGYEALDRALGKLTTHRRLLVIGAHPDDEDTLREHVRRLAWHARTHHGHLAFPGTQLLRLSSDLATGSAGILLALHSAFENTGAVLPYLEPRSTAPASTRRR